MPNLSRTRATATWTPPEYLHLEGEFTVPIFFKIVETQGVGKVVIQLFREGRTKRFTLQTDDPTTAMPTLVAKAQEWDNKFTN